MGIVNIKLDKEDAIALLGIVGNGTFKGGSAKQIARITVAIEGPLTREVAQEAAEADALGIAIPAPAPDKRDKV